LEENGKLRRPCKDRDGEIARPSEKHAGDLRIDDIKLGLPWLRVEEGDHVGVRRHGG
jgi:hypothetical protein